MRILFVNIFWYTALVYKTVRENYDLCGLALKLFLALAIIVYEIVFVYLWIGIKTDFEITKLE